jgi:hypothetical protein
MSTLPENRRDSSMPPKLNRDILFVLLSLILQVPLAVFLGHFYDDRVFMATGYLVNAGLNPYVPYNFAEVFPAAVISGYIPSIGYPLLWPMWLGLVYKISFGINQNLFLYNFLIKIPIIAADICLAFLVRHILVDMEVSRQKAQTAFLLILFNPFILLSTVAWSQIDAIVALLAVASFYLLGKGKVAWCAVCLAVAVALKPIALPLAPLPIFFSSSIIAKKKKIMYVALFSVILAVCVFVPFLVAGWRIPLAPSELSSQVQMAGGMTLFDVLEVFQVQSNLPQALGFLGYLWIPALLIVYYVIYRNRPSTFNELIEKAILVMLVFLLFRTWVSEPNLNLLLPLMLLAASFNALRLRDFHLTWIIPLIFMLPNYTFPQLFFLVNPSIMTSLQLFNTQYGTLRVVAQLLVVVVWQVFAIKIAAQLLHHRESHANIRKLDAKPSQ